MLYCSVCGTRIFEQIDNFGAFQSSPRFNGWDRREGTTHAVITDTCESCYMQILAAVVAVANKIVADNQAVVDQRRAELVAWQRRETSYAEARAAFEREWRAKAGQ